MDIANNEILRYWYSNHKHAKNILPPNTHKHTHGHTHNDKRTPPPKKKKTKKLVQHENYPCTVNHFVGGVKQRKGRGKQKQKYISPPPQNKTIPSVKIRHTYFPADATYTHTNKLTNTNTPSYVQSFTYCRIFLFGSYFFFQNIFPCFART